MLRSIDLIKEYGNGHIKQRVLKGINLVINDGEFVSIIGPSGAGKSTFMYQLSLLDSPTSGAVMIDDIDTSSLSSAQQTEIRLFKFGYVFQDYALLPELTAQENVIVPFLMRDISLKAAADLAEAALSKVGLGKLLNNLPSQLSGGEQQRVSIARAIAHEPQILFADEPTANLDTVTSRSVMDVFLALHKAGQTIVMVTHEAEYAALADRTVQLRDGQIVK
jgi:putative ABC transport system ATP-binding protein